MPAVWITLERLLHQQRQAIKALAHVGVAGRQPNPRAARGGDHRRRLSFASAFSSAETVDTATEPEIRIRPPVANSISMTPGASGKLGSVRSGNIDEDGDDALGSGTTVTALSTAGTCVRSQSC
jgi:hypothetical protein